MYSAVCCIPSTQCVSIVLGRCNAQAYVGYGIHIQHDSSTHTCLINIVDSMKLTIVYAVFNNINKTIIVTINNIRNNKIINLKEAGYDIKFQETFYLNIINV